MLKSAKVSINNLVHAKRMLLLLLFVVHNVRTPQSPLTQNTEVYNMTIEEASRFCFCINQYSGGTRPRAIDSKI